jgi:hypothetical protein
MKNIQTKILLLTILVSGLWSLVFSNAFSEYEFDGYKWGSSIVEIKSTISEDKQPLVWKNKIEYQDVIFDRPCKVKMDFTPKDKQLYKVSIFWDTTDDRAHVLTFGEKIRDWISGHFGSPSDMMASKNEYVWGGQDSSSKIELFYLYPTRLIYYGGKYYKKDMEENNKVSISGHYGFSASSEDIVT